MANGSDEQAPKGKSFDKMVKYLKEREREDIELLNISDILTVKCLVRIEKGNYSLTDLLIGNKNRITHLCIW